MDSQCSGGDYCSSGACVPKLPLGGTCTRNTECLSADCIAGACSEVIASGSGVFCSVQAPGGGGRSSNGLLLALGLAGVAVRRRRRNR
jgi:MYXO-CTERM domain-containing protein